jgi:hypothetical protein
MDVNIWKNLILLKFIHMLEPYKRLRVFIKQFLIFVLYFKVIKIFIIIFWNHKWSNDIDYGKRGKKSEILLAARCMGNTRTTCSYFRFCYKWIDLIGRKLFLNLNNDVRTENIRLSFFNKKCPFIFHLNLKILLSFVKNI